MKPRAVVGSVRHFVPSEAGYSETIKPRTVLVESLAPADAPHHQALGGRFDFIVNDGGARLYATQASLHPHRGRAPRWVRALAVVGAWRERGQR